MERQAEGPLSFYQRFLRITFRTFRCSCARARAPTHVRVHIHSAKYTYIYIHTYPRSLSFLSSPPPLVPPVNLLSYPPSPSFTPFSFCLSPRRRSAPPFVLFVVAIVRTCARVCTCVYVRLVSIVVVYARFHVARLCAPAARGRLCTWVNGKMSFETFLGRSRSPHCQSYTREICRSRENARRRASFRSTMPVASRRCPDSGVLEFRNEKSVIVSPLRQK